MNLTRQFTFYSKWNSAGIHYLAAENDFGTITYFLSQPEGFLKESDYL